MGLVPAVENPVGRFWGSRARPICTLGFVAGVEEWCGVLLSAFQVSSSCGELIRVVQAVRCGVVELAALRARDVLDVACSAA